jgi:histidine phosphotransferase ChpT
MVQGIDLRVLELLAARLCHELVSPIAAIANGVELLGDEDPEFLAEAASLVGESAHKAASRLQFYRFAFGFRGGTMAGPPPHQLVAEFFAGTRIGCDYDEAARGLSLEWQKLGCNLLAVGADALPRGGHLVLGAHAGRATLEGEGEQAGPSAETCAALALATPIAELTSRTIGAYFTALLAGALGYRLTIEEPSAGRFCIYAEPAV